MTKKTNSIKFIFSILSLLISFWGSSQSLSISSNPGAISNVAYICLDDNNTITYSATYTGTADSIVWTFTGGNITRDTGYGPITVTYSAAGTYSVTAEAYWLDTLRHTTSIAANVAQIAPINLITASDTLCESDAPMTLTGTPAGGVYSGTGVSNGTFDPDAAGPGNHTITYILNQGACSDTITKNVFVKPAPSTVLLAKGFSEVYGGVPTYTNCDTTSAFFFEFHTITDPASYSGYTIDFGDGTDSSGITFPTAPVYIAHTFPSAGLYTVRLTLNGLNGCSRTDSINVFIGVSPALGFTRSGSNSFCLPRDSGGYVEMCFNILNTASNDASTIYVLSYNDGSPNDTFYHPPPDSVCHRFYEGSCGFNASGSNNSFEVSITASNACGSNSFSNSPIYISEPPIPAIESVPRSCINTNVSFTDSSTAGEVILGSGACVNGDRIIWEINPGSYTLNGPPSDLGFTFGNTDPAFWFSGAQTLNVSFNSPGIYTVTQIAGNTSQCGLDTAYQTICIDSIPNSGFTLTDDTVCVGETITGQFVGDLFTLCDTLDLIWTVLPDTGGVTFGATDAFDTTQAFTFSISGRYDIVLTGVNECDSVRDTLQILVQGIPQVTLPADTAICGLTALDFSTNALLPIFDTNYSTLSYQWDVTPAAGWSFIGGTSQSSQLANIDFTAYGTYFVTLGVSNNCGTYTDTIIVSLTEQPTLVAEATPFVDTLICPGISLAYKASTSTGFGPFNYEWGSPSTGVFNTTDSIFLPNITADTTIYVVVTDALGL